MASIALPLKYHKTETKAPLKRSHTEMEEVCLGGGQELRDIALGKVRIMLAAENTGASSEHAQTNLVTPQMQVWGSWISWSSGWVSQGCSLIICVGTPYFVVPPTRTRLLVNEGMGVASHDPQHRQSQMLPVRIPRWPDGFSTIPSFTRARSMLLCRLKPSLQAQPSSDAPLYLLRPTRR